MNAVAALSLLTELLRQSMAVSTLIAKANAEKRDISAAELGSLFDADDAARRALVAAITAAVKA